MRYLLCATPATGNVYGTHSRRVLYNILQVVAAFGCVGSVAVSVFATRAGNLLHVLFLFFFPSLLLTTCERTLRRPPAGWAKIDSTYVHVPRNSSGSRSCWTRLAESSAFIVWIVFAVRTMCDSDGCVNVLRLNENCNFRTQSTTVYYNGILMRNNLRVFSSHFRTEPFSRRVHSVATSRNRKSAASVKISSHNSHGIL